MPVPASSSASTASAVTSRPAPPNRAGQDSPTNPGPCNARCHATWAAIRAPYSAGARPGIVVRQPAAHPHTQLVRRRPERQRGRGKQVEAHRSSCRPSSVRTGAISPIVSKPSPTVSPREPAGVDALDDDRELEARERDVEAEVSRHCATRPEHAFTSSSRSANPGSVVIRLHLRRARLARPPPVHQQHPEVGQRVPDRRHLPVQDRRDPAGIVERQHDVVDAVVAATIAAPPPGGTRSASRSRARRAPATLAHAHARAASASAAPAAP